PETALVKLRASIQEHVSDAEEQEWLEPRLAPLLRPAPATAPPPGVHSPRRRRAHRPRPGGSLLGVAALLRAARRAGSGGAPLRGSPVGRCRAARLHRVPARVVAQPPSVRARARTSGGGRTPAQLRRERPQCNEPLARGPLRGRDGATARRLRARAA